jgi:hypothetical protein
MALSAYQDEKLTTRKICIPNMEYQSKLRFELERQNILH